VSILAANCLSTVHLVRTARLLPAAGSSLITLHAGRYSPTISQSRPRISPGNWRVSPAPQPGAPRPSRSEQPCRWADYSPGPREGVIPRGSQGHAPPAGRRLHGAYPSDAAVAQRREGLNTTSGFRRAVLTLLASVSGVAVGDACWCRSPSVVAATIITRSITAAGRTTPDWEPLAIRRASRAWWPKAGWASASSGCRGPGAG